MGHAFTSPNEMASGQKFARVLYFILAVSSFTFPFTFGRQCSPCKYGRTGVTYRPSILHLSLAMCMAPDDSTRGTSSLLKPFVFVFFFRFQTYDLSIHRDRRYVTALLAVAYHSSVQAQVSHGSDTCCRRLTCRPGNLCHIDSIPRFYQIVRLGV